MFDEIQIIPVVETNEATQSDNKYILKYLNIYHGKVLQTNRVTYRNFVYARTKSQMTSSRVAKEIRGHMKAYNDTNRKSFALFFIDTDKFQKAKKKETKEIIDYCQENGFIPVLFSYEIEDVFGVQIIENDKKKTAELFNKKHHNKGSFNVGNFEKNIDYVSSHRGFSNLELVLRCIFSELKKD